MLDPEGRHLLLDALRPPAGYQLDLAVGTTYTLDLHALLTVPVAFAMFDRERDDGTPRLDPIAALQALRRFAGRITLFCQAGDISVPRDYRSLVVYLEHSVYQVTPPNADAIFHPKVWFIRFRHPDTGASTYRLLCLSRNLTFDRSWDTILRLEGASTDEVQHSELRAFVDSLPGLAASMKPVPNDRSALIGELAAELERVKWTGPDGMSVERFWPIGHDGLRAWPFQGRLDRIFVASPFVTQGALERLTSGHRGSILLSRPETFDRLGRRSVSRLAERLVLSSSSSDAPSESGPAEQDDDSPGTLLEGLHAKLVVADVPYGGRVWTGSANLTDAAFNGNVEFLTELRGRKQQSGVDAVIGDQRSRMGLRKITEEYEPATVEGRPETELELLQSRLERARRALGRLRYTASCVRDGNQYDLEVSGAPTGDPIDSAILTGLTTTIRPVTLGDGAAATVDLAPTGLTARFRVSYEAITPFFAFHLHPPDDGPAMDATFLVNAELIGAPADRAENVMVSLLKDRAALIRFLLLLLGNTDDGLANLGDDGSGAWIGTGSWLGTPGSEALLEPLVRAYSRDRDRLHEIQHVMEELAKTETGREILPEGWDSVWGPIQEALGPDAPV